MAKDRVYSLQDLKNIRDKANRLFPDLCLTTTKMYPHEGGILVEGKDCLQWVYFPGKDCGVNYDWALWKIVSRLKQFKAEMGML